MTQTTLKLVLRLISSLDIYKLIQVASCYQICPDCGIPVNWHGQYKNFFPFFLLYVLQAPRTFLYTRKHYHRLFPWGPFSGRKHFKQTWFNFTLIVRNISCGQRQSKLLNRLMQVTAVKKPAWSQVKLFKLPVLHETSSIIQIMFLSLSHKVLKFSKKSFSHFLVAKITELD